jgi:hypothetical protein
MQHEFEQFLDALREHVSTELSDRDERLHHALVPRSYVFRALKRDES